MGCPRAPSNLIAYLCIHAQSISARQLRMRQCPVNSVRSLLERLATEANSSWTVRALGWTVRALGWVFRETRLV